MVRLCRLRMIVDARRARVCTNVRQIVIPYIFCVDTQVSSHPFDWCAQVQHLFQLIEFDCSYANWLRRFAPHYYLSWVATHLMRNQLCIIVFLSFALPHFPSLSLINLQSRWNGLKERISKCLIFANDLFMFLIKSNAASMCVYE